MNQHEVIFYDEDEKTVLDRQLVNSGEKAEYKGSEPFKAPTNFENYKFIGWTNEEKLECVTSDLVLVARYESSNPISKIESALINASLENAKNTNLNATVEAGQKVNEQQKAIEKDSRSPEEIVNEILKNGKVELGIDQNKDEIDR